MKKVLSILLVILLVLSGCSNKDKITELVLNNYINLGVNDNNEMQALLDIDTFIADSILLGSTEDDSKEYIDALQIQIYLDEVLYEQGFLIENDQTVTVKIIEDETMKEKLGVPTVNTDIEEVTLTGVNETIITNESLYEDIEIIEEDESISIKNNASDPFKQRITYDIKEEDGMYIITAVLPETTIIVEGGISPIEKEIKKPIIKADGSIDLDVFKIEYEADLARNDRPADVLNIKILENIEQNGKKYIIMSYTRSGNPPSSTFDGDWYGALIINSDGSIETNKTGGPINSAVKDSPDDDSYELLKEVLFET